MRKKIFLGLISVVLLQVLIIFFGCNTTETIIKGIMPAADDLKKRVMVLPFIDQAGLGPDRRNPPDSCSTTPQMVNPSR